TYFSRYFTWYDTEHYHSGIDYVTPDQAHQGLRPQIAEQRQDQKLSAQRRRRAENQSTNPAQAKRTVTQN
ncbi:MAG: hypothetical protein ACI8V5_004444, partial [Limisphaerales bacterium]